MCERGSDEVAVHAAFSTGLQGGMDPAAGQPRMTEIPKHFLLPSPSAAQCGDISPERRSRICDEVHNREYEKGIAKKQAALQGTRFRVPVDVPLPPTTWEADDGCRLKMSKTESFLAPLFSAAATTTPNVNECPKLGFLKPAENNPRREIEERMKNERHLRSDPNAKRNINEPKKMPNLEKKVPADFVPHCAGVLTRAATSYMEECKRHRQLVESRETFPPRSKSPERLEQPDPANRGE